MQKVIEKQKLLCPRCGAAGALAGRADYYGSYLGCLICGWHGEADENGYPVMVDIPPPPIRRRRRRRKKAAAELSGELSGESGLESGGSDG